MQELLTPPEVKQAAPTTYQQRFRQGRLAAGASLQAVADALGKTPQYVSQFELSRNSMTVAQFVDACAFLRLQTEWVLNGRGAQFEGKRPVATKRGGRAADRSKEVVTGA